MKGIKLESNVQNWNKRYNTRIKSTGTKIYKKKALKGIILNKGNQL